LGFVVGERVGADGFWSGKISVAGGQESVGWSSGKLLSVSKAKGSLLGSAWARVHWLWAGEGIGFGQIMQCARFVRLTNLFWFA